MPDFRSGRVDWTMGRAPPVEHLPLDVDALDGDTPCGLFALRRLSANGAG